MGSNVQSNIWLCALAIPPMAERGRVGVDRLLDRRLARLDRDQRLWISKAADCRSLAGEWGRRACASSRRAW
jgi:hypothetical protein